MTETLKAKPQYTLDHNQQNISISVALPEVDRQSIKVTSEKNQLTIIAQRATLVDESWQLLDGGSQPSEYELKLEIDKEFDLTKIEAKFDKQILSLTIPEIEPCVRDIEIQ